MKLNALKFMENYEFIMRFHISVHFLWNVASFIESVAAVKSFRCRQSVTTMLFAE